MGFWGDDMFKRKSIYAKCFEALENELKINLENNYKDLAREAVNNLKGYVDSLENFQASGGKSVLPWIAGPIKQPPSKQEIEKLKALAEGYERRMEGYHH